MKSIIVAAIAIFMATQGEVSFRGIPTGQEWIEGDYREIVFTD